MKCKSCDSSTVNGVFIHEKGCPDAWKNHKYSCKNCGAEFTPESKDDSFVVCGHVCFVNYYGHECNCDDCTGGYPEPEDTINGEICLNCGEKISECECTEEDFE